MAEQFGLDITNKRLIRKRFARINMKKMPQ